LHFFSIIFGLKPKMGENDEIFGLNWEKIGLN